MVSAKIIKFPYLFILLKIGQEKVFSNVLDRKLAFVEYKNIDFKRSQNWHWFWPTFKKYLDPFFSLT